MKTVCRLNNCAGCMACIDACPVNAITIQDKVIAMNAVINEEKCIHCQKCTKICAQLSPPEFHSPIKWYQGWAKKSIREHSSSGGFASALMKYFLEHIGKVCTCKPNGLKFDFDFINSVSEIQSAVGSQYVKSNPIGIYLKIKNILQEGQKVLFIGLPCQCAGLLNFAGTKFRENLYTVDLICHGSPSPKILREFLVENKFEISSDQKLYFRRNTAYGLSVTNHKLKPNRVMDRYTLGFLKSVFYTENCYSCQYAQTNRITDLTIGDSWGSELSEEEQKKGISLVLCQTDKGRQLIESCGLTLSDVDIEKAVKANHQLYTPSVKSKQHDIFFNCYLQGKGVGRSVTACYRKQCMKQDIKEILCRLKLLD